MALLLSSKHHTPRGEKVDVLQLWGHYNMQMSFRLVGEKTHHSQVYQKEIMKFNIFELENIKITTNTKKIHQIASKIQFFLQISPPCML